MRFLVDLPDALQGQKLIIKDVSARSTGPTMDEDVDVSADLDAMLSEDAPVDSSDAELAAVFASVEKPATEEKNRTF